MNIFSILSFTVFLVYLFLGWYVFNLKSEASVNRIFLLLSACFAIWALSFTFFYQAPDKETAWIWYNLSAIGRFFYPAVLLHIVLVFTKNNFFTKKWYYSFLIYIPALIFLYAIFTGPFITQDLILVNSQWYEVLITDNVWWYAYNSYYLLYDFIALIIIGLWGYKSSLLRERKQALVIVLAGALALALGTLTNTVLQISNIYILPSTAQIFSIVFFLGIAYAIIKYQLLKLTASVAAEQIVSKITDLVILMDPEGKIININSRAENLLGYSQSDVQQKDWKFLVQDSPETYIVQNRLKKIIDEPEEENKNQWDSKTLEMIYITKNRNSIPIKSFCSIIKDKYGIIGILIVGQDLRQTRELEHEIVERIKAQNSAKDHAKELEILNNIIISVSKSKDLITLFKESLNSILILSNFSSGGIYLLDKDGKKAQLEYWENLTPEYINEFKNVNTEKNPIKNVITGSKLISGSYSKLFSQHSHEGGFISAGLVPLMSQNQVIGVISIFSKELHKFSDSQIEIMESMGREVGATITRLQTEDKIKKSLKEKEVLLKEIHHRVKNNMQIISSLLNLQSGYLKDKVATEALKECQGRIMSMAMIHDNLYQSDALSGIKFSDYIKRQVNNLFHTHGISQERVKVNIDADDVILDIDTAIPCGLIINELITNSLKHAFPDEKEGEISIQMSQNSEGYLLMVKDNGVGLPEDLSAKNADTLGLLLVNNLVGQLDGKLEINQDHGTTFKIAFKKMEYQERI